MKQQGTKAVAEPSLGSLSLLSNLRVGRETPHTYRVVADKYACLRITVKHSPGTWTLQLC